jgi:plasmid stabilization system protein ParE
MRLVYSRRALVDLEEIASYYTANASPATAQSIERRFITVIERICRMPQAAPRISQRSSVRVATVVRYPFRIFYRVRGGTIDILHIRHTSRRPLARIPKE